MVELERMMGQKQPQHTTMSVGPVRTDRAYPEEAYAYEDDVTSEAIAEIRARTGEDKKKRNLRLIDGFGQVLNA
jgi:hypothetical protein